MSDIQIQELPGRRALFIPMGGTKDSPDLVLPLLGSVEIKGELDWIIRGILEKMGVTDEKEVQAIIERAERDTMVRYEVSKARAKLRMLMAKRARGEKLMQRGHGNWVQVIHPAVKQFKETVPT